MPRTTRTSNARDDGFDAILKNELIKLEGVQHQNPDTGAGINDGTTYIGQYTNRIFGAPFQLMDSVDRRFESVNEHVGSEYLRNFLLNSPILHIKPGMPKYTGSTDSNSLLESIKQVYIGANTGMGFAESMLTQLAGGTIFSAGSKLQKRMFGFRETYYSYMTYVNYMCRSMATFLNLTVSSQYPTGTPISGGWGDFATMDWSNYRLLSGSRAASPSGVLSTMGSATLLGAAATTTGAAFTNTMAALGTSAAAATEAVAKTLEGGNNDILNTIQQSTANAFNTAATNTANTAAAAAETASSTSVVDIMADKVCSVMFMVEPVSFTESLSNTIAPSVIESALDTVNQGVGSELAFITNSKVDTGLLGSITEFLGDTVTTAANFIAGLTEPMTGGFMTNLFQGALGTIKGQKMIYPQIYKDSKSEMNYQFTVNLTSPYGDVYNYYMNIVVPLMHLIALAAPRMVTSNSVSSPFIVQAYVPGQCTCQLGIITNMEIIKNPNLKHVSVHGFPLDVTVRFTISELYNALSISPSNDPASFLFNETLNDYMSNLAGLQPSVHTYTNQRIAAFKGLENYFQQGEYANDIANSMLTGIEDTINPFQGR